VGVVLLTALGGGDRSSAGEGAPVPRTAAALPPGRTLTVVWGGDVTLGSAFGLPPDRARGLLTGVRSALRRADIAAVNLEGTLGQGGISKCPATPRPSPTCFAFQAPPENAVALREAGVDLVNLANNHAWDFGAAGMGQTVLALRDQRVAVTGRPGEITYVDRPGVRVAFVGFSAYPWTSPIGDIEFTRRLVAEADANANLVVVLLHAGAEGADQTHTPDLDESAFGERRGNTRGFAHAAVDAGADLVLGSGPHVLRGIELYRRRLIAYSLGNLAGYKNFTRTGTLAISGLLRATVDRHGVFTSGALRSLRLVGPGAPERDPARAAVGLVARVSREDFGAGAAPLSAAGHLSAVHPRR
jgi:hypothetical protein